ncbi:hypothetical protein JCM16358_06140 [Halanaerocella petrolearia]
MCMPMGAALAFKGIEKCILMLHGSQGCSTYLRRHIATHYNEPMDIASSSLTEKGIVYGGEEDLKSGLKNVIELYDPKVVGVATTCLAETIGEDITRLTKEFVEGQSKVDSRVEEIDFIPVPTPGYGDSHFAGYYLTLKKIIEHVTEGSISNGKINVITGNITPADIRTIKEILESFGIKYTLLPDISSTFDASYKEEYNKLPAGGTTIDEIKEMGGATATIELGALVDPEISPGKLLEEKFGVSLYRLPLPIGLENTDRFIDLLAKITGNKPSSKLEVARGRMLDGMIDSHKHNGKGRAAVFGDPETVYAATKICLENGIFPALIATGTENKKLKSLLEKEYDIEESVIIDDTDFEKIRDYANKLDVNLLLGHSGGNFITEKDGIPLVRIGFPIHDRIGAQRKRYVGYDGSMSFLDRITNTILEQKYSSYREDMFEKYFNHQGGEKYESSC